MVELSKQQVIERLDIPITPQGLVEKHNIPYFPTDDGSIYDLGNSVFINESEQKYGESIFKELSKFHFLNNDYNAVKLDLDSLKLELNNKHSSKFDKGSNFWKNFQNSFLNKKLSKVLGSNWRMYLDGEHHNDLLKTIYLLGTLHITDSSFFGLLLKKNNKKMCDHQLLYPKFNESKPSRFSAYLAELYSNILYHQDNRTKVTIKNLDLSIVNLFHNIDLILKIINITPENVKSGAPSIQVLKYITVVFLSHQRKLDDYIEKEIINHLIERKEVKNLNLDEKIYDTVAMLTSSIVLRDEIHNRRISKEQLSICIDTIKKALIEDAQGNFKLEADWQYDGVKETSLRSRLKDYYEGNKGYDLNDVYNLFPADHQIIPDIYSRYLRIRALFSLQIVGHLKYIDKILYENNLLSSSCLAKVNSGDFKIVDKSKLEKSVPILSKFILSSNIDTIYYALTTFDEINRESGLLPLSKSFSPTNFHKPHPLNPH